MTAHLPEMRWLACPNSPLIQSCTATHADPELIIVDGLSSDWSISADGTSARTVWFEISYP